MHRLISGYFAERREDDEEELSSGISRDCESSTLERSLQVKPAHNVFPGRDDASSWAVRLIDPTGRPVANARGGLYSASYVGLPRDPIIEGRSNNDGIMTFTEGRESLLTLMFLAEHKGRNLCVATHLDPDEIPTRNYKCFSVHMAESLT